MALRFKRVTVACFALGLAFAGTPTIVGEAMAQTKTPPITGVRPAPAPNVSAARALSPCVGKSNGFYCVASAQTKFKVVQCAGGKVAAETACPARCDAASASCLSETLPPPADDRGR